jgi:hypothetical protein
VFDNDYPVGFSLTVLGGENYTFNGTTITPVLNYNGDLTIPINIDDGEDENSQSDIFNLSVTVTPVNDAPVLTEIGSQETAEDTALVLILEASDVDENDLTFSATSDTTAVTVSISGDSLTMVPSADWNGTANITVTVSDGFLTDDETFVLNVTPVNDAPTIALPESFTFNQTTVFIECKALRQRDRRCIIYRCNIQYKSLIICQKSITDCHRDIGCAIPVC